MGDDRGDVVGRAEGHDAPPLPPSAGFPDFGTVKTYQSDGGSGRPWRATGIAPRVAIVVPLNSTDIDDHRQRVLAAREATARAARRAAPAEQAIGLVRIVPGLAAQTSDGAVHAIEGVSLPVRARDGIRFAIYLAPIDAPGAELVYHEAVHLHAAEGRSDPVVASLFEGVGFDEFDRAEGIGSYQPARRAEERLATAAGRILGADDHLPWPGAGAGSTTLRAAGNLHGAGHDVSRDAEDRRDHRRRLFHPSLTHPLFLEFLEELRTGALGLRPSDPAARESAIRRLGFDGYDDPRLNGLPRYSLGARHSLGAARRTTAPGPTAGDNDGLAAPAREVPMAAVHLPAAVQGRLPREPLPLGDPGVRAAVRPILDSWWRRQHGEVTGADRAIGSPDALLTDPSVASSADLARLRSGLLSTIADATGAREILISGTPWRAPAEPPYSIHGLPQASPERSHEGGGWQAVGTYASAAETRSALSQLAATGSYARLVVQAGADSDWRPERAAWAVSLSSESRDAPAEDFAAVIGAVRGAGLSLPATTLEIDLSATPTGEPAARSVTFQLASEQSARDFARSVARLGPWMSQQPPRRLPPPASSATYRAAELARLGAVAALAAGAASQAPDGPDLVHQDVAAIIDRLAAWDLPSDAAAFAERLPTPELAEAGWRLATELGWVALGLQNADLPTSAETVGTLHRIVIAAGQAAQASGGPGAPLPDLPDPERLREALAALPADTAAAARETLANYVDALTLAYDALEILKPGATHLRRSTLQGYGLDAGLPVISDPSGWLDPPVIPYPEIPHDASALDPAMPTTAGDAALVDRLQDMIRQGVDEATLAEVAVRDMLPDLEARFGSEQDAAQHLAQLIDGAARTAVAAPGGGKGLLQEIAHQLSGLADAAAVKATQLAEPVGGAIHHAAELADAAVRLGQGVLYSAREAGPAAGVASGARVVTLDDERPAGARLPSQDDRTIRHLASQLSEATRRLDRRTATTGLERSLSDEPAAVRETLLLAFGRIAGDPATVSKGDDPALLTLRRHAVNTMVDDMSAGLSSTLGAGGAEVDHLDSKRDRDILGRADKVLADAIPRAERQQARRDLVAVAGRAGLTPELVEGLRPTRAGFLDDADPRLALAVAEGVAERRPAALRLAARNAGLPGPYWVVPEPSAATALAAALDRLARDPAMAQGLAGVEGSLPIERTKALLAGLEPSGAPPAVLPPAETRTAMAAAALALAARASLELLPAVAAIAPARPWAPWTPPATVRPAAAAPAAGMQR